ncbi:hypothetical protein BB561_000144 [Smittium simulii]|uniref:Protein kinase domain-containing protein n=1 Tax=Smittium simulii TaxID=133385 RepID=A0A2T9Z0C9_9FUNG|nr:hypothetical protein BB561_000144 [Smittium simulii]
MQNAQTLSFENLIIKPSNHIDNYQKLNRIGEGAYGIVYRAKHKTTNKICAIKRLKAKESDEIGFPLYSLREIHLLAKLTHKNIVKLYEILAGNEYDQVFMAMEYCEQDLGSLVDYLDNPFSSSEIKCLMEQLLEGILYFHRHDIIHRDLKLSNILLNSKGVLKIADLGLARIFFDNTELTPGVITLWYRAPEILFGSTSYTSAIDMWSIGCIFAELMCHKPFMPGSTQIEQIRLIINSIGSFSKDESEYYSRQNSIKNIIPFISHESLDLLYGLFDYIPETRITAKNALNHKYFDEIPKATRICDFPRFPEIRNKNFYNSVENNINQGHDHIKDLKVLNLDSSGLLENSDKNTPIQSIKSKKNISKNIKSYEFEFEFDVHDLIDNDKTGKPKKKSKKGHN